MKSTQILSKFTQIYPKNHSLPEKTVSRPTRRNFAQVFSTQIGPHDRGGKLCSGNQVTDPLDSSMQPIFSIRGFYPNFTQIWVNFG